jgi:hypothetical protein
MYIYFVAFKLMYNGQKINYYSDIISTKEPVTTEKRLRNLEKRLAEKIMKDEYSDSYNARLQSITLMNQK